MPDTQPLLTVIIPAFNEEGVVGLTLERLRDAVMADDMLRARVDVVVVSDGSSDGTYDEAHTSLDAELPGQVVQLVTNVGSHAAVRCGLRHARGEYIAILAADGQDPPELLGSMIRAMGHGTSIVWGQRRQRRGDSIWKRTSARIYYSVFRALTGMDYPPKGYDFVMINRPVLEALHQYNERNASIFLMIFNLGLGQQAVEYDRGPRSAGQGRWTFRARAKLGIDMITGFTAAPIRLASAIGVFVGLLGFGFGGVTIVRAIISDAPPEGWASLMVVTSVMGGMILVTLALIGEYLWRTLDEVRARPIFLEFDRTHELDYAADGSVASGSSSRPPIKGLVEEGDLSAASAPETRPTN